MGKRRRAWTQQTLDLYNKEGRGQGRGKDYKPWLTIHDFPSQGRSSQPLGWKTNRIHHFLSDNELRYFFLLEWSDTVTDIREQFPLLDVDTCLEIARDMGIRYPTDTESNLPYILTTDFMVSVQVDGKRFEIARTIKPAKDLSKTRVIEKLELERRYWLAKGVDWGLVTDTVISREVAKNIEWVHSAYWLEPTDEIDVPHLAALAGILKKRLVSATESINKVTSGMDLEMNVESGTFLYLFKHLIARKEISVNMNQKINNFQPAKHLKIQIGNSSQEAALA